MKTLNNKPYCYVYYNPISSIPFYVGKGINSRASVHLKETLDKTDNPEKVKEIQQILQSGKTPIIKVMYTETDDEAFKLEEFLTYHWGLRIQGGLLTNLIFGGKNGYMVSISGLPKSEEHKRKIGEGNRLANKNPETTERKRKAGLGNTNGTANKGRKCTWGDKISEIKKKQFAEHPELHNRLGTHMSEESKIKISKSKKGKKQSEEHKKNIGAALLGGKRTEETKAAIAAGNSLTWEVILPSGEKEIIQNLRQFCKEHKISDANLGKYGHTKGYYATKVTP